MALPRAAIMVATLVACLAVARAVTAGPRATTPGAHAAFDLAVGARVCPVLGVGVAEPELSWKLHHTARGQSQSAFRVVVRTAMPGDANQVVWGTPLQSDTTYTWTVTWWDRDGGAAPESEQAVFDTALLQGEVDWAGVDWIAGEGNMLRREFTVSAVPSRARAYISGLGWFQLYINGQRVGTDALSVGWTRYDKRAQYATYDVTSMLTTGTNVAGVLLGYGWRNASAFPPKDTPAVGVMPQRVLRMQVVADSTQVVVSDKMWAVTPGPIVRDSVYNGEIYDARLEQPGWATAAFTNASKWASVTVTTGPGGMMFAPPMGPITIADEIAPVGFHRLDSQTVVVDFGRNFAGFCRIRVKGAAGTTVVLRHAEVLMHEPYGPRNGSVYTANLRSARATDMYTLKGAAGGEQYQPHFTYHGFRYVEITNFPDFHPDNITALHFHTDLPSGVSFETSSIIINTIQTNAAFGQQSNLMSVPTDCDQRDERLGWMGDAGLSADSMATNFQTQAFHANYLDNIHDEIDADGSLPDVTPFMRYGNRPADVSWSAAFPQILWVMYTHYGATSLVTAHWDGLGMYLSNLASQLAGVDGNIALMPGTYGDWVTPGRVNKVSVHYTSGFNYIVNLRQSAELAEALGRTDNATALTALADKLAGDFHTAWYHANNASYADGRQTAFSLALFGGVVPPALVDEVGDGLLSAIVTRESMHVSTGIIGTKAMFPVLSSLGRTDTGVELVEQLTWPSFGFMAFNDLEPATTFWELWSAPWTGPGMNSRNHHMFSSISLWLVERVGGLGSNVCASITGARVPVHVAEVPAISRSTVTLDGPCGRAGLSFQRRGGMQCAKAPENQGPDNMLLPHHEDMVIDCGAEGGGTIATIDFASFGTPFGPCGGFAVNASCHAADTMAKVEALCKGKTSCTIPTDASYYGNPCPGTVKRMFVQATCSAPSAVNATLTLPPGPNGADMTWSLQGLDGVVITEGADETPVWRDGSFVAGVAGVVGATYNNASDSVTLQVQSGSYTFGLTGVPGQRVCASTSSATDTLAVACPAGRVVTDVGFASYGTATGTCGAFSVSTCDLGATVSMVERACMGKTSCNVAFSPDLFQDFNSDCGKASGLRAVAQVTCGRREQ